MGEGWFPNIAQVPEHAISMSVRQILAASSIVCVVPDRSKAEAVRAALEGPVDPVVPASSLRTHNDVTIYLDRGSAALVRADIVAGGGIPKEDTWLTRAHGASS